MPKTTTAARPRREPRPQIAAWRRFLAARPDAEEGCPFGPQAYVYKVGGKMFAMLEWTKTPAALTLKCDPVLSEALRKEFPTLRPGYHMNKRHWITAQLDGAIAAETLRNLAESSHELVLSSLPSKVRKPLATPASRGRRP